jgi:NitT/TauT family transport system ATP-binding protein
MIAVDGLEKCFGGPDIGIRALEDVSFAVERGEFVSIVGPSGCGKTTLLRIIAGTVPATRGSVQINGRKATGPSTEIGMVFQAPVLFPWRTVLENVLVPADVRRVPRSTYREKATKMLATAGLAGFENEYPWRLSGGMQQRAAICRALVYDPPVLLLDEPFGALDAMTREVMNAELMRLCALSQPSVVLITHSISEAVFLSDRVLVMSSRPGRLVADIPIDLPRPRSIEAMGSGQFAALTHEVRTVLASHHGLTAR